MKYHDCDRRWEIDALREGRLGAKDAEAFERHLRSCDDCAVTAARDAKLRALASSLPAGDPNELALRRMRARVLHDVAVGVPARRHGVVLLAVAVALLSLVSWTLVRHHAGGERPNAALLASAPSAPFAPSAPVVASPPPATAAAATGTVEAPPAFAGAVVAIGSAQWSRDRQGLVERVRLEDGTLRIHVRHQANGERFLVDLPDGELEVRGTTFEVGVRGGETERVAVEEGVVAVRRRGHDELVLKEGESWNAPRRAVSARESASGTNPPSTTEAGTAERSASVGEPSRSKTAPSGANAANGSGADEYAAAVALMQSGRYAQAATEFHTFVLAHASAPEAEDASFLEAASLARAGRADAAALAAEDHLARFPKSFHRKDAAILVARAARDRGDCAQARAVLAPWSRGTAEEEVRATLKKCAESEADPER